MVEAVAQEHLKRQHLLIAGTGRAGTSFLVRYLTAFGLDTHLARRGDHAFWSEDARAGLEDEHSTIVEGELPYVVKSPWLHEFSELFLASPDVQVDALLIPVRKLQTAACSRIINELQWLHRGGAMPRFQHTWETWGSPAPGGAVFSLEPLDQARILAVGLHQLIEAAVSRDVRMVFLDYVRLISDPEYLFTKLRDFLPKGASPEQAAQIHSRLVDGSPFRVEQELEITPKDMAASALDLPDRLQLDNIALRREVVRVQKLLEESERKVQALQSELEPKMKPSG